MIDYKTFREFLREQKCEEAFDRAFYLHNDCTAMDDALWKVSEAAYIFGHAFDWSATPEGREYWLTIDRKWYNKMFK